MDACCGLLTMGLGVFYCTIAVVTPTGQGGGGGPYPTSAEFLVPFPKELKQTTRMVLITVKIGEQSWRKSYVVQRNKAEIVLRVMNLINTAKDKMFVGVDSIKKASRRVSAVFRRTDK